MLAIHMLRNNFFFFFLTQCFFACSHKSSSDGHGPVICCQCLRCLKRRSEIFGREISSYRVKRHFICLFLRHYRLPFRSHGRSGYIGFIKKNKLLITIIQVFVDLNTAKADVTEWQLEARRKSTQS